MTIDGSTSTASPRPRSSARGALVEYEPRHRAVDAPLQPPVARHRRDLDGAGAAGGLDKLRFVTQDIGGGFGNKICPHPQLVALCLLARKLEPAGPVDGVAHRPAHGERRTATSACSSTSRSRSRPTGRCSASTSRRSTTAARSRATSRSAASSGRRSRRASTAGGTSASTSRRCARTSRRSRRTAATRACSTSGSPSASSTSSRRARARPGRDPQAQLRQAEEMPYETPNGCVYDSGDYARCLDMALELVGHDGIEERRREAEARGKLLGFGIGSTLDSGTNNFGQSTLAQPGAPVLGQQRGRRRSSSTSSARSSSRSGRCRRARGTRRRRRRSSRDILGGSPDARARAAGPRQLLELARGLLRHVREPVRGHRARRGQGRDRAAAREIKQLAAAVLAARRRGGDRARRRVRADQGRTPRRRSRSWRSARS